MPDAQTSYRTLASPAEFDAVQDAWDALHDATGGPFLSHAFLSAWLHTIGRGLRCEIRTAWRSARLVGALPLVACGPPRALVPAGDGRLGMTGAMVAPDIADAPEVLGRLLATPVGRYLRIEPVEMNEARAMEDVASGAGLDARVQRTIVAQSIDFQSMGFDAFVGRLSRNTRRAYTRSARDFADVDVRATTGGDAGVVDDYAAVARLSWKGAAGTGITATPEGHAFLRRFVARARPGTVRVEAGFRGEEPVFCTFSIIAGDTHYLIADEFNEAFSGAGSHSVLESVRWSNAQGHATFDFMRRGSVNDKLMNAERGLYRVVVSRRGDPTRALLRMEGARRRLRRRFAAGTVTRRKALAE